MLRGYVANTDIDWYRFLRDQPALDEVNFWFPRPGNLLAAADPIHPIPFLFKLKKEGQYKVCGFGFLAESQAFPAWYAWDTFGVKNGTASAADFYGRIAKYRKLSPEQVRSAAVGCLVVVQPTFFPPDLLVPGPEDWKRNIQRGQYYDLTRGVGARLWRDCIDRANAMRVESLPVAAQGGWGAPEEVRPRLGQGAFRVAVTRAYEGACAVTREHSLPVVDAAHIRPYAEQGSHDVRNGIALRADLHRLFDRGYVTFDEDGRFVVSGRLREDFDNGRRYYALQEAGTRLWTPKRAEVRPDGEALAWHREAVFLG